jgi:hypothetical protein
MYRKKQGKISLKFGRIMAIDKSIDFSSFKF